VKPQSPYAASKFRAEQLLNRLGQFEGLKYFIGRFGTIFGTSIGMRFHTAINKFCWQAVNGQPITVWRTALHQRRPYLDLSDAIRALDFILKSEKFDNEIYNILTVNSTVHDIIEVIRKHVPDLKIDYVDSKIMNQLSYNVARSKFEATGFRFIGNLEQGIRNTIDLIRGMNSICA
jgi:nucleoside-diphosphate-sugar epimerase